MTITDTDTAPKWRLPETRPEGQRAYSIEQFAREEGIGRGTVYAEIREGRLRARKVGRRTIITAEDAAAWRNNLPDWKPDNGNGSGA